MLDRLYRFMLATVRSDAQRQGQEMASLTDANFLSHWRDREQPRSDPLSCFVRWLLTPTESALPDYQLYLQHLDRRDLRFALSYVGINSLFGVLRKLKIDRYWHSTAEMEARISYWDPSRKEPSHQYPLEDGFVSFAGLDWFFNTSAELFTQLRRRGPFFYIDTQALNTYPHKDGMRKLGARGEFLLVNGKLELQTVVYETVVYQRGDTSEEARTALRALYGSYSFIRTVLTHAIGIHWKSSAEFILKLRDIFPESHPLRQVLMPTELGALNGLARAAKTLLSRDAFFHEFGPLTYEGLNELIRDYIAEADPCLEKMELIQEAGLTEYKEWRLSEEEVTALPFASLHAWLVHIHKYATEYVDTYLRLYPDDIYLQRWEAANPKLAGREALIKVIGAMYLLQIIHSSVANSSFFYIFSSYSYILRTGVTGLNSHSRISTHFMQMIVDASTSEEWFHIELDVSSLITEPSCREVWHRFYLGMKELALDSRLPIYQPSIVPGSTGL